MTFGVLLIYHNKVLGRNKLKEETQFVDPLKVSR